MASGNGEQVLARDVYRLGQLLDFPRMLSFFFTSVGFYVTTMVYFIYTMFINLFVTCPSLSYRSYDVAHVEVLDTSILELCSSHFLRAYCLLRR